MMSLNPLLLVGGVIGTVSVLLLIAYACVKDKKTAMGFERSMPTARSCAASSVTPSPTSGSSSSWAFSSSSPSPTTSRRPSSWATSKSLWWAISN